MEKNEDNEDTKKRKLIDDINGLSVKGIQVPGNLSLKKIDYLENLLLKLENKIKKKESEEIEKEKKEVAKVSEEIEKEKKEVAKLSEEIEKKKQGNEQDPKKP